MRDVQWNFSAKFECMYGKWPVTTNPATAEMKDGVKMDEVMRAPTPFKNIDG